MTILMIRFSALLLSDFTKGKGGEVIQQMSSTGTD